MLLPAYYETDLLRFFAPLPDARPLYDALTAQIDARLTDVTVRVQKTQITFVSRRVFGCVSLPVRRVKGWPDTCLIVTFGLPAPLTHPRIFRAVEPYPGRWTHHVVLAAPGEADGQLLDWLAEAQAFSLFKR